MPRAGRRRTYFRPLYQRLGVACLILVGAGSILAGHRFVDGIRIYCSLGGFSRVLYRSSPANNAHFLGLGETLPRTVLSAQLLRVGAALLWHLPL